VVKLRDGGVIRGYRALDALLRAARGAGVDLHCDEKVRRMSPRGDGVLVETTLGTRSASAAVVAAGPWSRALLRTAGIDVAMDVSVQSVAYFRCESADSHLPAAVIDYEGDEPYACWDGEMGLKAALHARGPEAETPEAAGSVSPAVVARVSEWVRERYAALRPTLRASGTCLYTNTPDERSAIERHGRIVSAAACNGQGFQLAPESGDRAAALAIEAVDAPIEEERR
jgi:sarcosine oxidase